MIQKKINLILILINIRQFISKDLTYYELINYLEYTKLEKY